MSAELELRWLKTDNVEGTAKQFSKFCKKDIYEQSNSDDFDIKMYQDAIRVVLDQLNNSDSIEDFLDAH